MAGLRQDCIGIVNEWSIFDSSQIPHRLLESGLNEITDRLMEDSPPYQASDSAEDPVKPLDDPDFNGVEAALRRAATKAIRRAREAGLEPVILGDIGELE